MKSVAGKIIVLTGASAGIGRATALELGARGAVLHLIARREHLLARVCEEVRAQGGQAFAHALDVRDTSAFNRTAADIHAIHPRIDVLINNAGVGAMKTFMETSEDDWRWTFDTNLHAMVTGIRAFLPPMVERGSGTIVNVASLAGLVANTLSSYTASKFAVVGLSESLLVEFGHTGIDIVCVCPGFIATEIAEASAAAGRSGSLGSRLTEQIATLGVQPDLVARDIVRAIHDPRFLVLTPSHASVIRGLHRVLPNLARSLIRRFA